MPDYYSILGVSRSASKEEIKKAYRRLAMKWHPDHNPSPDAKQKFIQINDAYERLTENKPQYVYKRFTTKKPAPTRPKTSREMDEERTEKSRERVRRHAEQRREQFASLRKKFRDAPDAAAQKRKLLLEACTDLSLIVILFAVVILVGAVTQNLPLPIFIGAFGLRAVTPYFISGRKKLDRIRMIYGKKENYTIAELEEVVFYNEE
jgi:hypothetical protein